ncbi:uncharacterized protein LOC121854510 [Homarus americanus]|uniref:uncharacterized protein LOC121854510 n=1 Tax=Homarus americanus TaxID=6706 RepID=UPI001C43BD2E|nr:uncharacterized protein LOC121854510 [Homarus americanus]
MIGLVLVMAMVVTVLGRGEEDYYNAYGFTKMMTNCFGNDLYYDYIRRVGYAKQECSQQPLAYPGQFTGSGGVPQQSVAPLPQQVYGYPNTPLYPNTGLYPQVFTLQQPCRHPS